MGRPVMSSSRARPSRIRAAAADRSSPRNSPSPAVMKPCPNAIGRAGMARLVTVEKPWRKIRTRLRPSPQPRREGRAGHDRRVAPMVRHHQQRDPVADVTPQQIAEPVHLALKARRDVVDRRQQKGGLGRRHGRAHVGRAALFASPLTKLHLRFRVNSRLFTRPCESSTSALSIRPPAAACAPMSTRSCEPRRVSGTKMWCIAPGERDEVVQRARRLPRDHSLAATAGRPPLWLLR